MEKPKFNGLNTNVGNYYNAWEVDAYIDKLFKDAVRVYGTYDKEFSSAVGSYEGFGQMKNFDPTHAAYLIGIEPIEKKECEHSAVVTTEALTYMHKVLDYSHCAKCGKKIKAKWEVCE